VSITSGLARLMETSAAPWQAWAAAWVAAVCALMVLAAVYAIHGKSLIAWPSAVGQHHQPYFGTRSLEWAALLRLPRPGVSRRPALWAAAILFLGLALPRKTPQFAQALIWWGHVGGPGWCMLLSLPFLFAAGFARLGSLPTASHASDRAPTRWQRRPIQDSLG
jgi:hypothetical protein